LDTSITEQPRVLIVEDDSDTREVLDLLLDEQGYAAHAASSLEEALAMVDAQTFQCILTDLFADIGIDPLASIAELQRRAYPTPIVVMTAWPVAYDDAVRRGIRNVLAKPFNLDELLAEVAESLDTPLSQKQEQQARVVLAYFDALTAKDWDALIALCTNDVIYVLPGALPYSGTVQGKAAFRTYTEDTYRQFPDAVFDEVHVYAQPLGLAARFHGRWRGMDGSEQQQSGAVVFQFAGERIARIGVELNTTRLQEIVQSVRSREPSGRAEST
jgi:CheY-like chemotaxis protein